MTCNGEFAKWYKDMNNILLALVVILWYVTVCVRSIYTAISEKFFSFKHSKFDIFLRSRMREVRCWNRAGGTFWRRVPKLSTNLIFFYAAGCARLGVGTGLAEHFGDECPNCLQI